MVRLTALWKKGMMKKTANYLPLPEREAIGVHGGLLAGAAGHIIEASGAEVLSCLLFEFVWVRGDGRKSIVE